MRATEVIRGLLDIIDGIDDATPSDSGCGCGGECGCGNDDHTVMVASNDDDELRRFKQILGLVGNDSEAYANSPDERVSDLDSVTIDAGGGVNGPKHPADIRGEHPRLFGGN
jgi:hypothetical protein